MISDVNAPPTSCPCRGGAVQPAATRSRSAATRRGNGSAARVAAASRMRIGADDGIAAAAKTPTMCRMGSPCAVDLRPARAQEARALALMSRDLVEAGLDWRYTPARMAALLADPETSTVVACAGDRPHGFAVMQFGDDRAHLALLAVQPTR